jgi:hypothetical protein
MVGPSAAIFGHSPAKLRPRHEHDVLIATLSLEITVERGHRGGGFREKAAVLRELRGMQVESTYPYVANPHT